MGKIFEIEIFILKYVLHSESITIKRFRPKNFVLAIFTTCDPIFSLEQSEGLMTGQWRHGIFVDAHYIPD